MKGKIADGEARDRLIIWIRRRMEEFGITAEALAASSSMTRTTRRSIATPAQRVERPG